MKLRVRKKTYSFIHHQERWCATVVETKDGYYTGEVYVWGTSEKGMDERIHTMVSERLTDHLEDETRSLRLLLNGVSLRLHHYSEPPLLQTVRSEVEWSMWMLVIFGLSALTPSAFLFLILGGFGVVEGGWDSFLMIFLGVEGAVVLFWLFVMLFRLVTIHAILPPFTWFWWHIRHFLRNQKGTR